MPLIEIEHLTKIYGDGRDGLSALNDVNLTVTRGEFISIVGPSGCGKSTLLRVIADLLDPTSGQVRINGLVPRAAREQRTTAFVFQAPTLMEWRTIQANVALPLEIRGMPEPERMRRARTALEPFHLDDFSARYPSELSCGMQQQVAIARALAAEPTLLLMDEPFGALDELTREHLGQELVELWERRRVTVMFVTHSLSEAVFLSDRVAVLSPRPGHVEEVVMIDLPRPRMPDVRESPEFAALVARLRAVLHLNGNGT